MRSGHSVENSQSSSTADSSNSRLIHDACSQRTWRDGYGVVAPERPDTVSVLHELR
jgi:hypothetical protein